MNRIAHLGWVASVGLAVGMTTVGCTSGSGAGDSGLALQVDQPTAPDLTIVDEFTQTARNSVNIVWVLDPGWMSELENHREEMARFYELLLLHGVPWRVAVLSPLTEPDQDRGELRNIHQSVVSLDTMGPQYFQPFGGAATPTNFRAAVDWMLQERREEFEDFWFAGGHLSIIAFADTEDQTLPGFVTRQEFITNLAEQDATLTASISAITVGLPEIRASWEEYANATGGIVTSSPNAPRNLEAIALASLGIEKEWVLSEIPAVAPESIVLTYRGNQRRLFLGQDYSFDYPSRTLRLLGEAPLAGTRITVTYNRRIEGAVNNNGNQNTGATQ